MNKHIVTLVIVVIFIAICFSGCFNQTDVQSNDISEIYEHITSIMKTDLPDVPDQEVLLNITYYITTYQTCHLDAGASIGKYVEGTNYDEFVWYGRPALFKYEQSTGYMRTGCGGAEFFLESFYNLGYKVYVGRTLLDYIPNYERLHMTADDNFIFFSSDTEAFTFVKKLLSADVPVMIQIGSDSHYHYVLGYDETNVVLPPYETQPHEHLSEGVPLFNQLPAQTDFTESMTISRFLDLWSMTGNTFYWMEKSYDKKTSEEIFEINEEDAQESVTNTNTFMEELNSGNNLFVSFTSFGDAAIVTASASRYLSDQGYNELAEKYMEIASVYNDLGTNASEDLSDYVKNKFSIIAGLYDEVADLWIE